MLTRNIRRLREEFKADVESGSAQKTRRLGFQGDPSGTSYLYFPLSLEAGWIKGTCRSVRRAVNLTVTWETVTCQIE